jgi:two-component system nitrogen regulation response regulator GlnG
MSEATAICEMSRSTLAYFPRPTAHRRELADCRTGTLEQVRQHRPYGPLESRSAPELRVFGVPNEIADHHRTPHLLFIGDDSALTPEQLCRAFPTPIHRVQAASTTNAGLESIRAQSPDVIILDLGASDQSRLDVLQQIRCVTACIPVIVITRCQGADLAIQAMKHGAYDCLFEPVDLSLLQQVVVEALDVARHPRNQEAGIKNPLAAASSLTPDSCPMTSEEAIIGACPAMAEVYKAVGRVAVHDVPVLITGESGTGKELVARAIFKHGSRAQGPFLALNCAAIPENLLESELFGHEKGAFTGADRRRIGKFEQCHGGTLFLDEIGDMPPALQGKILRLLQEQSFERVGGNETIRADVRLIAASHRDLKTLSAEGKFRADLYYRLGVFTIHLPPLRERREDLPLLVQHFLRRFSRELGRAVDHVAPEAMYQLRHYHWPGNIRELQSVLKQALLKASGAVLLPAFLPETLQGSKSQGPGIRSQESGVRVQQSAADSSLTPDSRPFTPDREPCSAPPLDAILRQRLGPNVRDLYTGMHRHMDRQLLPRVLEYTRGSQHQAALLLGIARQTLREKLRQLGLSPRRLVEAEAKA